MKTFLGNSPWGHGCRVGVKSGSRWPFTQEVEGESRLPGYIPFPFYLAYAAAVLEKNEKDVELVDGIAEGDSKERFLARVGEYSPDLVVLETSTPSIREDLDTAKRVKDEFGSQVALSGPHATTFAGDLLAENDFIDFVLAGEYEHTLLDLVNYLEGGGDLGGVLGLAYRDGGGVRVNERRPLIKNLDELHWPARHFLPMKNYNDAFAGMPTPNVQIWASRGCPFRCIFCLWPHVMYGGQTYRLRDYVDVVDEMEHLVKEYDFKGVYFDDDTFNVSKDHVMKLAREIKSRDLGVKWAIMARADTMDREMLEVMRDAGLYAVKYGVESGVQEIIDGMGKNLDLGKVEKTVADTKELGIKTHLTFTFGLPGETWETVEATIDFAIELDPDSVQFSITTPFPGTKYYDDLKEKGWLYAKDWNAFDGAGCAVLRTEHMSREDLERAYMLASKRWFKHQLRKNPLHYLALALRNPASAVRKLRESV